MDSSLSIVIRLSRGRPESQISFPLGAEISVSSSRSRRAVSPRQSAIHCVPFSFTEVNVPGRVADHSPLSSAETTPALEDQGSQRAVLQIIYLLLFCLFLLNNKIATFTTYRVLISSVNFSQGANIFLNIALCFL
jgi:hypothetical protein